LTARSPGVIDQLLTTFGKNAEPGAAGGLSINGLAE
jgi:hypothetical protein